MAEYFTKDGDEYKKVDDTLFTQSDIDTTIMPDRLNRERKKYADYDDLKEKAGKFDSVTEELNTKITTAESAKTDLVKQLEKAKLDTEKVRIVNEFKLSADHEEFVTGDTVEELRKKAEKLSRGVGTTKITPKKSGKPENAETDSKVLAGKLFGKKSGD